MWNIVDNNVPVRTTLWHRLFTAIEDTAAGEWIKSLWLGVWWALGTASSKTKAVSFGRCSSTEAFLQTCFGSGSPPVWNPQVFIFFFFFLRWVTRGKWHIQRLKTTHVNYGFSLNFLGLSFRLSVCLFLAISPTLSPAPENQRHQDQDLSKYLRERRETKKIERKS